MQHVATTGRPTKFTPELVKTIFSAISVGTPLSVVCEEVGVDDRTVANWCSQSEELFADYRRARTLGWDRIAHNTRRIARGEEGYSSGDPARDKLIIETDLRLLRAWDPKRYGDRTQVDLKAEVEVTNTAADFSDLDDEDREALRELLERARAKRAVKVGGSSAG